MKLGKGRLIFSIGILCLAVWVSEGFIPSALISRPNSCRNAAQINNEAFLAQTSKAVASRPSPWCRTSVIMSAKGSANNYMSPESYTEKAWEAITRLPQLATRYETQYVDSELLLKSLLDEGPTGLAQRILFKAGAQLPKIESELDKYISSQPRVSDTQNKVMGNTLSKVLDASFKEKDKFGDQYVSIEHILLGLVQEDTRFFKNLLTKLSITEPKIRDAVVQIRGAQQVGRCVHVCNTPLR